MSFVQLARIYRPVHRYLLLSAWLIELILLAIPPPACMLLANASSKADCVTEASIFVSLIHNHIRGNLPSRSLKLLPILGVPSLPFPLPLPVPANSAVRRGLNGPTGRSPLTCTSLLGAAEAGVELAEESDVCDKSTCLLLVFAWPVFLPILRGSPRSVALGS